MSFTKPEKKEESETTAVLGKRKHRGGEREDGDNVDVHGSTVFVSNLPYTATSTDLQTLFSDIAPVRSAFVVKDPVQGTSKGVGYVSFAIREDAEKVMESISGGKKKAKGDGEEDGGKKVAGEPLIMDGRKLRVQWADKKPKAEDDGVPRPRKEKPPQSTPQQSSTAQASQAHSTTAKISKPKDPNAIRTIVISGLAADINKAALWKKIRKLQGAENVELADGESGVAYALFQTNKLATHAIEKLHAHVFKGSLLSVTLKKLIDTISRVEDAPVKGKQKTEAGDDEDVEMEDNAAKNTGVIVAPSRANRLIVRNLPWNITERDLRAIFLPYGPIHSIHIPTSPSTTEDKQEKRAKGFAFVWFLSRKDAERAIAGANGQTVRPGAVFAPTMNKKEKERARRQLRAKLLKEKEAGGQGAEHDGDGEGEGDEDKDDENIEDQAQILLEGRVIAVDWALSKEQWEKVKPVVEPAVADAESGSVGREDSESDPEANSEEEDEQDEEDEEGSQDEEDEDDSEVDDSNSELDNDREDEAVKPTLPPPEAGTTLFVRNVPFDAGEDELRTLFRTYGPLRYARITVDPETGRSRGTGFVCFWKKEDADTVLKKSEEVRADLAGPSAVPTANPFKLSSFASSSSGPIHSILTPDPTSSLAKGLVLGGRTLDVVRAVTRDEAGKLKDEGDRKREKNDKRSLHLLREGVIFPNSYEAEGLPAVELETRILSYNRRRQDLKANPNLFVSRTRLSVRRLPLFVSEKGLKKLVLWAIKEFKAEVKAGKRKELTENELAMDDASANDVDAATGTKPSNKMTHLKQTRKGAIQQAKIVRQKDRIDALTGHNRSTGFGFVELATHADALRVLRFSNNNPAVRKFLKSAWTDEVAQLLKFSEVEMKTLNKKHGDLNDKETERKGELEGRIKRLQAEKEKLEESAGNNKGDKESKTLIVEFAIENLLILKKRDGRASRAEEKFSESSKRKPIASLMDARKTDAKRPKKRPRPTTDEPPKAERRDKGAIQKLSNPQAVGAAAEQKKVRVSSSSRRPAKNTATKITGGSKTSIVGTKGAGDALIARKRRERRMKKAGK